METGRGSAPEAHDDHFPGYDTPDIVDPAGSAAGRAAELERLVREGSASWPGIDLPEPEFREFLVRHVLPETTGSPNGLELRSAELYLVCAYGLGHPEAQEALELHYMCKVRPALSRIDTPAEIAEDIQQELRRRLIETGRGGSTRRGYSGQGSLSRWLLVCAVREAWLRRGIAHREVHLEDATAELVPALVRDADRALMISRYKGEFQSAFREAIRMVSSRERNLLRYHFLMRLSIDQIGRLYHVHRATAARWITRAQSHLAERTRDCFLSRVPLGPESVSDLAAILQSHLSLSLGIILSRAVEPEPLAE